MARNCGFKVGDAVFYPSAGVGIIESEEDIYLTGVHDRCFVIRIHESGAIIKVPCVNMSKNGIRPLLDGKKVKDLYKVLAGSGTRRTTAGNPMERTRELARKVNAGSCMEIGEVVRDLLRWKKLKSLSFEEVRLLQTGCNHLSREVAVATGTTPDIALSKIREQVGVAA
jgi:RNA polymerase-interacting CarD/CdnL/TRCF family regulator